jgi:hypothetical protein
MITIIISAMTCGIINYIFDNYRTQTLVTSKPTIQVRIEVKLAQPILTAESTEAVETEVTEEAPPYDYFDENELGRDVIELDGHNIKLVKYKLPRDFNPKIDDSSFQPFMRYEKVTNKSASAYKIIHSENAYTDNYGFRRYKVNSDKHLTVDGKDDYIVALGNYYKKKGEVGVRYFVVTSTGSYTMIVGDEKSNAHTDQRNQYTTHGRGKAGVIEWVVSSNIHPDIKRHGTVTRGPIVPLQGKIKYIYKIVPTSI